MIITKEELKLKLNSCYDISVMTAPTFTDDEIIQKVRKQIWLLYRYITECEVRSELYQYGRVEGMLYAFFAADRLSMEDYEQFTYAIVCMDNEFYGYGRSGLC